MVRRGGYELVERVAEAPTATVWKARDVERGRDVAVKQLAVGSAEGAERLRAGAARAARLADEHVVEVFGFFTEGSDAYLVEQWVDGASLADLLATGSTFSTARALGVCRDVLLGLSHAHRRRVVHGDVSPAHVLVDAVGTSRLTGFGFADRGSPAADVHAAALLLVQLLVGTADGDAVDRVDAGLRPMLDRALAEDPAVRYQDAGAALAALDDAATRRFGEVWWSPAAGEPQSCGSS